MHDLILSNLLFLFRWFYRPVRTDMVKNVRKNVENEMEMHVTVDVAAAAAVVVVVVIVVDIVVGVVVVGVRFHCPSSISSTCCGSVPTW